MSRRRIAFVRSALAKHVAFGAVAVAGLLTGVVGFSTASASVVWRGDFETGDLSQWYGASHWGGLQAKDPSRAQIVTSPVRQGKYALAMTVQPGDNNVAGSQTWERTELLLPQGESDGYEGHEAWYAWSEYFPSSTQHSSGGVQFHPTGNGGPGQTGIRVWGTSMNFTDFADGPGPSQYGSNTQWYDKSLANPIQTNTWYDIVLHIKWSKNATGGFFESWLNGNRIVPYTVAPTLFSVDDGVYLKIGVYRAAQSYAETIVVDGVRRGGSYADVVSDFPAGTWPSTPDGTTSTAPASAPAATTTSNTTTSSSTPVATPTSNTTTTSSTPLTTTPSNTTTTTPVASTTTTTTTTAASTTAATPTTAPPSNGKKPELPPGQAKRVQAAAAAAIELSSKETAILRPLAGNQDVRLLSASVSVRHADGVRVSVISRQSSHRRMPLLTHSRVGTADITYWRKTIVAALADDKLTLRLRVPAERLRHGSYRIRIRAFKGAQIHTIYLDMHR
jgi:Polysaccharide lyase